MKPVEAGAVCLIVGVVVGVAFGPTLLGFLPHDKSRQVAAPREKPSGTPYVPNLSAPTSRPAAERVIAERVLIITIDGLRPDLIGMAPMPRLRELAVSGSYSMWAQTVDDPYVYTLPAHVSLLTGVNPDRHGITWNDYVEWHPNVPTIFEVAKAAGMSTAMATGKSKFVALDRGRSIDWVYLPSEEPVPDMEVARQAASILKTHRPRVMFVHFPNNDVVGHAIGWGSPQQLEAARLADAALAHVLDTLSESGLAASTLVLLTADHGGAGVGHGPGDPRSRTVPWIAAGPGVRKGLDLTRVPGRTVRNEDTFVTACESIGLMPPVKSDGAFVQEILDRDELLH